MQILNIIHVLIAIALVGFVLIQKGQGATAGAAFGSGASGTVFGARGAGNFLSRTTWVLAALFCTLSLTIAVLVSRTIGLPESDLGVVDSAPLVVPDNQERQPTPEEEAIDGAADRAIDSDVPSLDGLNTDAVPEQGADAAADLPLDMPGDLPTLEDSSLPDDPDSSDLPRSEPGTGQGGF